MENENKSKIAIELTAYQWTQLLEVIRKNLSICNWGDQRNAIVFYEYIATALNDGKPVKMIHEDNPDPNYRSLNSSPIPTPQPTSTAPLPTPTPSPIISKPTAVTEGGWKSWRKKLCWNMHY